MVRAFEYETYLKVKAEIEKYGKDKILEKLKEDPKYVPVTIGDWSGEKEFITINSAAKYCKVSHQTLKYSFLTKQTKLVRKKGGEKESTITWK